jgi:ribosomal protein S6--L-glutamate ligase
VSAQPILGPPILTLGWQEWISLPRLGLGAIKAKIDTGARTSALHAFDLEPAAEGRIAFKVHPIPRRADIVVQCEARLVDSREITSSNGERERRVVIETEIEIAGRRWPIEVTLTNRALMRTRMLLGRQALAEHALVDPAAAVLQPRLSYKVYRSRDPR